MNSLVRSQVFPLARGPSIYPWCVRRAIHACPLKRGTCDVKLALPVPPKPAEPTHAGRDLRHCSRARCSRP